MKWIRADRRFADRLALLIVTRHDLVNHGHHYDLLDHLADSPPDAAELILLGLIQEARPELAGCTLIYMGFASEYRGWEFMVSHGSLPRMSPGAAMRREFLYREAEEEHSAQNVSPAVDQSAAAG